MLAPHFTLGRSHLLLIYFWPFYLVFFDINIPEKWGCLYKKKRRNWDCKKGRGVKNRRRKMELTAEKPAVGKTASMEQKSPLYKPLCQLTEDDIVQVTREDCRRFLKEKGHISYSFFRRYKLRRKFSLLLLELQEWEGRLGTNRRRFSKWSHWRRFSNPTISVILLFPRLPTIRKRSGSLLLLHAHPICFFPHRLAYLLLNTDLLLATLWLLLDYRFLSW